MPEENLDELNACARILYASHGCNVPEGYDFSTARHPQERGMFALAKKTREFWSNAFKKEKSDK